MGIRNSVKSKVKPSNQTSELTAGNLSAVALLDTWIKADEKEQKETFEYLKVVLDEDRTSNRKLFK
jgi:hypothetical protein